MEFSPRYVHTNLIANDWKRLSDFYQAVFECVPVPPERDLSGPAIEAATNIEHAHIRGEHLRLPGWGKDGPTLEIFSYSPNLDHPISEVNRPGFGHIAFSVTDVELAKKRTLESGGKPIGEVVRVPVGEKAVTFCYLTDPEGNIIELQSWS